MGSGWLLRDLHPTLFHKYHLAWLIQHGFYVKKGFIWKLLNWVVITESMWLLQGLHPTLSLKSSCMAHTAWFYTKKGFRWKLQDLSSCYRVYVAVTGSPSHSFLQKSSCMAHTAWFYAKKGFTWKLQDLSSYYGVYVAVTGPPSHSFFTKIILHGSYSMVLCEEGLYMEVTGSE